MRGVPWGGCTVCRRVGKNEGKKERNDHWSLGKKGRGVSKGR